MIRFLLKLLPFSHKEQVRQFYKFGMVGVTNTLIDFLIFLFLTRVFAFFSHHFLYANVISFSIAVTNSYYVNRRWTFKSQEDAKTSQYLKFFIISGLGLAINTGLLYLFVYHGHLLDIVGKAFAIIITLFWNFFMNKWLVFKS